MFKYKIMLNDDKTEVSLWDRAGRVKQEQKWFISVGDYKIRF